MEELLAPKSPAPATILSLLLIITHCTLIPRRVEWIRITSIFCPLRLQCAALLWPSSVVVCMTLPYYWTLSSLESSSSQKHPKDDARVRARRPHEKPNVDHATPSPPPSPRRRRRVAATGALHCLVWKPHLGPFFLSGYKFLIFLAPKFKCFCMIKPNVDHATATEGQGLPSMEWWPFLIAGLLLAFLLNFWNFGLIHICFIGYQFWLLPNFAILATTIRVFKVVADHIKVSTHLAHF